MRRLIQLLIVLLLPVFLVLTNVRLLMTSTFARWEYTKPGFPDPTMFSVKMRQPVVDTTIAYVRGAGDVSLIRDMTFEDGRRVYNAREVRHLVDVRVLTRRAFTLHLVAGLLLIGAVIYLAWSGRAPTALRGLVAGSILTIGSIVGIGVIAVLSFGFFFVRFHRMFFEGETWIFPETDTLIQVFPERFWFDASLLIVLLTLVEAAILGGAALAWLQVRQRRARSRQAVFR